VLLVVVTLVSGSVVVLGNANEKIIIHEGGSVTGDLDAPKVILKDNSYFKGNISMSENKKIESAVIKEVTTKVYCWLQLKRQLNKFIHLSF
jgi:cytoskeletal protein CcmA (bactofilin family)